MDVLVTLPDGTQRVVDDTVLRLPPAQEPPIGSYVRVAVTGADEMWYRPGQWAAVNDPATPQPWSFVVARDLGTQPTLVYRGGERALERLAERVLVDNLRVATAGGRRIRVRRNGPVVDLFIDATADTLTLPAAAALGFGCIGASR